MAGIVLCFGEDAVKRKAHAFSVERSLRGRHTKNKYTNKHLVISGEDVNLEEKYSEVRSLMGQISLRR